MKKRTILSCPICRSKADLYSNGEHGYFVCCDNFDRVSEEYATEKEAIKAWNTAIIGMKAKTERRQNKNESLG